MKKHLRTYTGLTKAEKDNVGAALDSFITDISQQLGACPEAIATAAFYRL